LPDPVTDSIRAIIDHQGALEQRIAELEKAQAANTSNAKSNGA